MTDRLESGTTHLNPSTQSGYSLVASSRLKTKSPCSHSATGFLRCLSDHTVIGISAPFLQQSTSGKSSNLILCDVRKTSPKQRSTHIFSRYSNQETKQVMCSSNVRSCAFIICYVRVYMHWGLGILAAERASIIASSTRKLIRPIELIAKTRGEWWLYRDVQALSTTTVEEGTTICPG